MNQKGRLLFEVSEEELRQSVVAMCKALGISGSAAGYDLYEAVHKEWKKSVKFQKMKQKSEKENL